METVTTPEVRKSGGLIGAEAARPGPDPGSTRTRPIEAILRAWAEHGVIFFRDQHLDAEQRDAFASRLGEIRVRQELRKEPEQTKAIGEGWHTDMTCFDEPPKATILFCEEVPPWGGDTQWAAMGPTFEGLSAGLQATLLGLSAIHANVRKLGYSYAQTDPPEPSISRVRRRRGTGAPGRAADPRDGAARALREPRVHHAGSRDGPGASRCRCSATCSPSGTRPEFTDPVPLGARLDRDVGQPADLALRGQRLPGPAPRDAPHPAGGIQADPRSVTGPRGHGARVIPFVSDGNFCRARQSGRRRRLGMLAVLGALSSFGPLSMDMYLPSTPTIAANLHASQWLVQLTLSGCLSGPAVGQLVAGPVSDGLGRKRPLLAGLIAFTVLSVACAVAPDIGALIVFRFLRAWPARAAWCCRSPSSATCTPGLSWPGCSAR